jgi:putative colanic acid biosynthesis acetyltransferase WcaF
MDESCSPSGEGDARPSFYASDYRNRHTLGNKLAREAWGWIWLLLGRTSPVPCFAWRRWLLRLFGARLAGTAKVYPTTRVWAPWNLSMEHGACLGPEVYCYNVAPVAVGVDATASFRSFLCTASHDIRHPDRPLVVGPIRLERGAFVFADAFVGMNVVIHEGAVVAARAVVVRSVAAYEIVAGNPARVVSSRDIDAGP